MEYFKTWIFSLCGAGIITSIFKILVSNSNVKKSINIFLSMFVFLYTIIPIESMISDFEININNDTETNSYNDVYKDGYETIIIKSIEKVCENNNVSIINININSYIDNDGYLVVEKIEIELSDSNKNQIIERELKEQFDYEVIFI